MANFKVVQCCAQCRKGIQDSRQGGWVEERNKTGLYTGRRLLLCNPCQRDYFAREIKEMPERMGKLAQQFKLGSGKNTLDLQLDMEAWNKNLHQ